MKKILTALLIGACLTACSGEPDFVDTTVKDIPDGTENTAAETADDAPADASFSLVYGDVTLELGQASDIPALLGEPDDRLEAPSCVHEGSDALYYYDGLELVTMMTEAGEILYSVSVTTEDAATAEGLKLGMTVEDAVALYGDAAEAFGQYTFTRQNATLKLFCDPDGVITSMAITG